MTSSKYLPPAGPPRNKLPKSKTCESGTPCCRERDSPPTTSRSPRRLPPNLLNCSHHTHPTAHGAPGPRRVTVSEFMRPAPAALHSQQELRSENFFSRPIPRLFGVPIDNSHTLPLPGSIGRQAHPRRKLERRAHASANSQISHPRGTATSAPSQLPTPPSLAPLLRPFWHVLPPQACQSYGDGRRREVVAVCHRSAGHGRP